MGIENELRFEVTPRDLKKLAASRSLRPIDGKFAKHKYAVSTYFDTPDHILRHNGVSLRIKQVDKKRVQKIKATNNGTSLGRGEWERKLENDTLDLRAARGTALEPLLSKKLSRDLDPIFATHVHRTSVPLRLGNSRVELALEEGHVRAGESSAFLAEVELGLKNGSVADLFKAARMVTELVPVRIGLRSKSEQGYDLIADQPPRAAYASRIKLQRKATLPYAFQVIGRSVLQHIAANEAAVLAAQPEGVHQMRVGVRRLRAAIWVFSKLLHCKQTEMIKRDLKWLSNKLGPVRDLDTFLTTKIERLASAEPPISGLPDLTRELEYRRAIAAEAAKIAVVSSRYCLLIFNTLEWIENGTWLKHASSYRNQRIKSFAVQLFFRRSKKTKRWAKEVRNLDVRGRHKLRITVKKLRYTIYFFESLFSESTNAKALSRYKDHLAGLQNNLGALNDVAVRHKLVTKLGTDGEHKNPRLVAFAAGAVVGSERSEIEPLLDITEKAAHKLRRARKFWI